jgi:hypothetical protein
MLLAVAISACCMLSASAADQELKAILEKVAVNKEVMAAVSNSNLISEDGKFGMLAMWVDGCKRAGMKNFMVIAIDDRVAATMKKLGVAYWRKVRPPTPAPCADSTQLNSIPGSQEDGRQA